MNVRKIIEGEVMRKLSEKEFREYSLSGNLYLLIIKVGMPLAIFALFNCLFSLLDTIMASHLGKIDVSTVAYMSQLRMILSAMGSGLITGSMILINRAYGAGDNEKANILMNTLIRLVLILSLVFLLLLPFAPLLLELIRTPEEFIEEGTVYFRIIVVATIINFINLIYINVEKARGNTKTIMIVNILTMIIKLLLSAFFIYVLEKGIAFIALATLITYVLFALYALPHLFEKGSIFCIKPRLVLKGREGYAKNLVNISYPVAVEDSAFSLGKVVVNSMAAQYGAEMVGALGISNNISGIASNFENGFSDASSSIISQNYGAKRYDRAIKAYLANIVVTFIASLIAMTILYTLDDTLIKIFSTSRTGLDASFMSMIKRVFVYDSLSCFGIAFNGAGMDFLLGLGKTRITLFLNFLKIFVLRIPVLFILQHFIADGATALGVMMMISNCGGAIPTTIICLAVARKLKEQAQNSSRSSE